MIRHRERTSQSGLGSGIIIALVIALAVPLAIPRVAHADIGDEPSSSGTNKPGIDQVQDTDKPREPSLLENKPADAAVQKKAAAPSQPIYEKWQFWAITGGIVVGGILAILAGQKIAHQVNGGDVRPCNPGFLGCFGEGQ
jgi:hypothetical protein